MLFIHLFAPPAVFKKASFKCRSWKLQRAFAIPATSVWRNDKMAIAPQVKAAAGPAGPGSLAHNPLAGDAPSFGPPGWAAAARLGKAVQPDTRPRGLSQARSLRRASRVHSELSAAPVPDKHAPEKAKRRASFFEPLVRGADLLSPYAAALARFNHAAGTADRVRRQALKNGRSAQVSRASHCVDCEGKVTNHRAAATRAAREAGLTLKTHLDELESTLEQQLDHEAMKRGDEAPQPAAVCSAVRRFSASLRR